MISTGFTSLDGAIGGLAEKKDYLIYGPVGSGKSGFAMNFLHAGLVAGEIGVLVTRRSARMVLDHARTFGWDFEPFLSDSRMILFEYMPRILQKTAGLGDENQIVAELYRLLEGTAAKRLVFDPLTPILEGTINTNVGFPVSIASGSVVPPGLDEPLCNGYARKRVVPSSVPGPISRGHASR